MEKFSEVESVLMRNVLKELWSHKKKIGMLMAALCVAGGIAGFTQSKLLPKTEDGAAVKAFEQALANYDASLKKAEDNLRISEKQLAKQQDYVDNSPYMKLNPQKVWFGEVSYRVDAPQRIGDVIQSYNNYVNRNWISKDIIKNYNGMPEQYLKEHMWSGNNGNMWTASVIGKDEADVKARIIAIKEAIAGYKKDVKFEHSLTFAKESFYVRFDNGTKNNQNGQLDLLRRYGNDINIYKRQLADLQRQKDTYSRSYKPQKYLLKSPVKAGASYAGAGAVLGLILSFVYFTMKGILGGKVKTVEELLGLEIPVLSVVDAKGYTPALERTVAELSLLAQKNDVDKLFVGSLADKSAEVIQYLECYREKLAANGLQLEIGWEIANSAEELKQFVAAGKAIAVVQLGTTSYKDLQNYLQMCKKFDVEVWGLIVIA